LEECIHYISNLVVPEGYETEVLSISDAACMTAGYNEGMRATDAKYKVYMHQDVFLVNRYFINDILSIFASDSTIGLIGMVGYATVSENGVMWKTPNEGPDALYGSRHIYQGADYNTYRYSLLQDGISDVALVDGLLMATAYDLEWDEENLTGWHFYDAFQSMKYLLHGYRAVVPNQTLPWFIHDDGKYLSIWGYKKYLHLFTEKYGRYLGKSCKEIREDAGSSEGKGAPTVSVLMMCYNHEKYVGEAIRSVLAQTYTDFEFIIVDNGCTDNSYEVIKSFDDKRIRILRLEKNSPDKAFRVMREVHSGKYIAIMCSDDFWEPDKLRKQMNALTAHPDILISATWSTFADEEMKALDYNSGLFRQKNRSRLQWIRDLLEYGNCFAWPSVVVECNLFKRMVDSSRGFWQLQDYYMWLIALQESNIYIVEEVLVKQRLHTSGANANMSASSRENDIRVKTEQCQVMLQVIENMSDEDFKRIYAEELIFKDADSHLEMICEKFFYLLRRALKTPYYEDDVIYYYMKYVTYAENGIAVGDILGDKYQYTNKDFKEVTASMGQAAVRTAMEEMVEKAKRENV
jgi:glycosyltransferase involved in cell wall biosynthesis